MHNKSITDLERFLIKCDEIINSKFILADSKISELLNCIADSEMFYNLFKKLTIEFNYNAFKDVSLVSSKENENRGVLMLPESTGDKLAFIFCLLMEIDNKKIDLNKFLQCYFYEDGSYFESYYAFCNQVIKPFKNLVKAAAEELFCDEHYGREKNTGFIGKLQGEKYKQIEILFLEDKEKIMSDTNISDEDKADIIEFFDGFLNSMLTFDKSLIKLLYIGYKNIVKNQKKLSVNFIKIEKLLNENGIKL
jgi:hypothetical protein